MSPIPIVLNYEINLNSLGGSTLVSIKCQKKKKKKETFKLKQKKLSTLLSTSTKSLVFLGTACTGVFMYPQGSRTRAHGQEAETAWILS